MRRFLAYVALAAALAGGGYLSQHRELLKKLPASLTSASSGGWKASDPEVAERADDRIRIATFNIQVFGKSKLQNRNAVEILAQVIRRFDAVAIQEVRAMDANLMPEFLDAINASGSRYEFAIGPRLGRTNSKEQYAFIFDTDRIELDRTAIYTVDDPDDLLHREPLVAPFRVRGPSPQEAFTFTLVNIHTDPDDVETELNTLDDVVRAVRNDGRGEDDVILLGDLNADDAHYGELGTISNITWALSQTPTNSRRTHMYDNLIFDRLATTEFDGRASVLDLQTEFQLTAEQALQVSDHNPVWAEFSAYEAGRQGPLVARPGNNTR